MPKDDDRVRQVRLHLAGLATELGTALIRRGAHADAEILLRRAISIYLDEENRPCTSKP